MSYRDAFRVVLLPQTASTAMLYRGKLLLYFRILESRTYLFCDTSPMTTYVFAKDYHGYVGPTLTQLAREAEKRYDLFFLCDTDIPYADTWDRSGDHKRQWFQNQITDDLAERRVPFFRISGPPEERITQINTVLQQHCKFGNVLDIRSY